MFYYQGSSEAAENAVTSAAENAATLAAEDGFFEAMGVMRFIILLISLAVLFWVALKMVDVAEDKGYDYCTGRIFALCFLFNIVGYLYVIALPDLKLQRQNEKIIELLTNIDKNQDANTRTNQAVLYNLREGLAKQQTKEDTTEVSS